VGGEYIYNTYDEYIRNVKNLPLLLRYEYEEVPLEVTEGSVSSVI